MGVGVSCQNCYRLSGVNYSREKLHFRFATGSDSPLTGINQTFVTKNKKGCITDFWKVGYYYLARILPFQNQQWKH